MLEEFLNVNHKNVMPNYHLHRHPLFVFLAISLLPLGSPAEDFSKYRDAGTFWQHIQDLYRASPSKTSSREEAVKMLHDKDRAVDDAVSAFCRQFPDDPRRWDAKILQIRIAPVLARLENNEPPKAQDTEALLHLIQNAADASAHAKEEAAFELIRLRLVEVGDSTDPGTIKKLDGEIRNFAEIYPDDQRVDHLNLYRAKLNAKVDPVLSETILKTLTSSSNKDVAAGAEKELKKAELMRQPLELNFQAVDGQPISLQDLRGKIVLVDFWATWCGPCMHEAPNVVATYNQLHEHGFEIVGISLDTDINRMRSVTGEMGMTWPQYCDGKGWQNKISSQYGIDAIPTTWLLDKRGYVRYVGLRGKALSERIQELQAE